MFGSWRNGKFESFVCQKDGSKLVKLPSFGKDITFMRWSPDGQHLLGDDGGYIWVRAVEGGALRKVIEDPSMNIFPIWSRDGRWIYFSSDRRGELQLWKMPAQGGAPSQVTQHGGVYSEESPDGRFLYYSKAIPTPTSLWRVAVGGGEETQVLESLSNWGNFTVVPEGIYFIPVVEPGANPSIKFFRFATGEITTVKDLDRPVHTVLSASPDGQSLLYTQVDREGSDLMLVENFR